MRLILPVIFLCFLVSACSAVVKNGTPVSTLSPEQRITIQSTSEYRIQPGDNLDIKFLYNPELSESLIVRPDGRISLQLAHEIMAGGKTPEELVRTLREAYEPSIARPEITVIVRAFNSHRIFVDGEVAKPGIIPLTGTMTLMQAISAAGGVISSARLSEIVIMRKGADNKAVALTVDAEKIIDGTDMGQDIVLAASDIVYVPKSPIGNVNKFVDLYIRKNIPVTAAVGFYATQ